MGALDRVIVPARVIDQVSAIDRAHRATDQAHLAIAPELQATDRASATVPARRAIDRARLEIVLVLGLAGLPE